MSEETKKELTNEEIMKQLEEFRETLKTVQTENATLKQENEKLTKKLNNIHVDSIAQEIGNNKVEPEIEDVEFDFDI